MEGTMKFQTQGDYQLHFQEAKTALSLGESGTELGGQARADAVMIGLLLHCHVKVRSKL